LGLRGVIFCKTVSAVRREFQPSVHVSQGALKLAGSTLLTEILT
jgi:hypothetical protein